MMEYKRLTKKFENGYVIADCTNCPSCNKCDDMAQYCQTTIKERLAELEDKMEQGDLVSIKSVSKFIEMAFASEPPCNYEIDGDDCVDVIETNTKEWCETHCDVKSNYVECWEQYLRAKLKELQNG